MAEKSLGYVELEWTCPSCNSRNPGGERKCRECGAPMPEETKFDQAAQEKIITDEAKIAEAKAGPDIYCAYCGTRNPASGKACKQCGAPLGEGRARAAGAVLGGLRDAPAPPQVCPACGSENTPTALKCQKCGAPLGRAAPAPQQIPTASAKAGSLRILLFVLAGLVALVVLFVVLSQRTTELVGNVSDYRWRRAIAVEALVPVTREGWRDQLPSGVEIGQCRKEVYQIVDEPQAGAREVCGTPYVEDKGSGYGEVKQDCQYEVLADYCEYRTLAWSAVAPLVLEGRDLNPLWPAVRLADNQRAAGQSEEYIVVFAANDREYSYRVSSEEEYRTLVEGKEWALTVNAFGDITSVSPR